jgi:hypothetical protein
LSSLGAEPEAPLAHAGAPRLDLDRARSAGELLSAAFEIYVRYWRGFLIMALAVVIPLDLGIYGVIGEGLWSGYRPHLTPGQAILVTVEPLLLTVPLVTAVHVRAVQAIGVGQRPPVWAALRQGLSDLPAVATAVLIAFLATALGFIALIIPGIYIGVRLAFCAQAVVVEGHRSFAALDRSWNLVRDTWWRTFGILILLNVVSGAASSILAQPINAAAKSADSGQLWVLSQIVANTIAYSFTALAATLLYFDLAARRAGSQPRAGKPVGLDRPERVAAPPAP